MASLLPFLLLFTILLPAIVAGENSFIETTFAERTPMSKISKIHFYFHSIINGLNATAVEIVKPRIPPPPAFGSVIMMDDPLTEGPEPDSKPVGRAQGMYALAAQEERALLMMMNLYFTEGRYNGSVLTVMGRLPVRQMVREMPIVGGSGLFRFARGYALTRTYSFDPKSTDGIFEYNVTVMHH